MKHLLLSVALGAALIASATAAHASYDMNPSPWTKERMSWAFSSIKMNTDDIRVLKQTIADLQERLSEAEAQIQRLNGAPAPSAEPQRSRPSHGGLLLPPVSQ